MRLTDKTRFFVEALEKIILIMAVVKREYTIILLLVVAGLITAKMYADIVDIKKNKRK